MNDSQDDLGLIGGTAEVVEDEDEVAELAEISWFKVACKRNWKGVR